MTLNKEDQIRDPRIWSDATDVDKSFSVFDYLSIVLRRGKLISFITVLATIATAAYAIWQPNTYTAVAKLLPPQQPASGLSAAMMQGGLVSAAGGADILGASKATMLYVEMLKLDSLRDLVAERLKLRERYDVKSREELYSRLNGVINVQAGKEGIISVSVGDTDPKQAAEIANVLIEELKRVSSRMSMTGANNTRVFLEEQLAGKKGDLAAAENDLKAFQQKYKIIDVTQQATATATVISNLVGQLTLQELRLGSLREQYSDSSQEVVAAKRAIELLKEKIDKIRGSGEGGTIAGLEKIPERAQEYLRLMRKFKAAEAVYESISKQYEVARFNSNNDVSTIQVLQTAVAPERKSGPRRVKMVVSSLFLSLLVSSFLAFGLEYLKNMPDGQKERFKSLWNAGQ